VPCVALSSREDFAAATRGLVERLFTADADAELLE